MVITRTTRRASRAAFGRERQPDAALHRASPLAIFGRPRVPLLAVAVALWVSNANAESWRIVPTISWESTLTDNVNLTANRKADWVNQVTPGIQFSESGAHTQLSGAVSVPMLVYARSSESDHVFADANIAGSLEAIDNFLFIDALAGVSQQYASPFGPRSTSLANATENRYTAQTYVVTPRIQGTLRDNISYALRDVNSWTDAGASSSVTSGRSYQNELAGNIRREPLPVGWAVEYDRNDLRFADVRNSEVTEIERLRGLYRVDATLELSGSAGYEDNRFFAVQTSGMTYGAGVRWRPNRRTSVNANWEHRFFGSAYDVLLDHTTRLSTWTFHASRSISDYPQQLGTLPQGADVSGLLNALFANRVQDPLQRQALVDQLIRDRGLPAVLSTPVPLLAQQITLVESETATMGLLGARNSVFFSVFRFRNEPIEPSDSDSLASLLSRINVNNTQTGANVVWTHQLSSTLNLATSVDWSRVTDNANAGAVTRMYSLRAVLSRPLSALTSIYGGARYQNSRSSVSEGFREAAIFFGLSHTFH